jgi:hypothetical protein
VFFFIKYILKTWRKSKKNRFLFSVLIFKKTMKIVILISVCLFIGIVSGYADKYYGVDVSVAGTLLFNKY